MLSDYRYDKNWFLINAKSSILVYHESSMQEEIFQASL